MKHIKTAQAVFDEVSEHLFKQGERSYSNGMCTYRDGARKCAFGLYITEAMYVPALEGKDVEGCIAYWKANNIEFPAFIGCHAQLLRSLQILHDDETNWIDIDTMKEALCQLAHRYNLSTFMLGSLKFDRPQVEQSTN